MKTKPAQEDGVRIVTWNLDLGVSKMASWSDNAATSRTTPLTFGC